MHKRGIGLLLGLTIAIALVTLYQDYRFDRLIADEHASSVARERTLGAIADAALSLHAAQAAAVSAGQATTSWTSRADELALNLKTLVEGTAGTSNERFAPLYAALGQSLTEVQGADRRIRAAINRGDRLVAADLVFMDGADATRRLTEAATAAREAEATAAATRVARFRWLRVGMNAVALIFAVIVAVYFSRASTLGKTATPTVAEMLSDLPPAVTPARGSAAAAAETTRSTASEAATKDAGGGHGPLLGAAADLCADLAKVIDTADLPALLERTATVLDARGVVLWAADAGGVTLRPIVSHGYSARVMAKLPPIQIDSDNVTARAFRSLEAQALAGAASADHGALAVPLVTAGGCVGVLAAETRRNRPAPDLLPIARIVAAQFSALVSPVEPAVEPSRPAQANG